MLFCVWSGCHGPQTFAAHKKGLFQLSVPVSSWFVTKFEAVHSYSKSGPLRCPRLGELTMITRPSKAMPVV